MYVFSTVRRGSGPSKEANPTRNPHIKHEGRCGFCVVFPVTHVLWTFCCRRARVRMRTIHRYGVDDTQLRKGSKSKSFLESLKEADAILVSEHRKHDRKPT